MRSTISELVNELKNVRADMTKSLPEIGSQCDIYRNFAKDPKHVKVLGLEYVLRSSLQQDYSFGCPAMESVWDFTLSRYDQKDRDAIDDFRKNANDVLSAFKTLATLSPIEELQRKIEGLQLYLSHCNVKEVQPITEEVHALHANILRSTPRDITNDFKQEFKKAMSFLKSFTCKSKEDTDKTIKEAISLLVLLKSHQVYQHLSEIPITLTIMCLLWKENEDKTVSETMTTLFQRCVCYMAEHGEVKTLNEQDLDYESIDENLKEIMRQIGETAWKGLLQNKLTFSGKDFDHNILLESCRLGLLTKQRKRSKLRSVEIITFTHKCFQ